MNTPNIETDATAQVVAPAEEPRASKKATSGVRKPRVAPAKGKAEKKTTQAKKGAKNTFAWGFGRYKFQHEPLFYAHVAGQKDPWYGDKSQSTLWQENKPAANRTHPTAKPVELIERALLNSSKAGDLVADLFGGSGSTLIACERRNRRARLVELDPKYADCIVRRWEQYTGKTTYV